MLKRVMIISGESSGELYGAFLAKALKTRNPGISIIGVGGDRMQSEGVELISKISSSFGITEAIKTYREIRNTFKKAASALQSFNPQVLVLIDYPDFNIRIAKKAKELGIKVLYYVSPQVWAWRKGRIKTIAKVVDKMAVILPFEEDIYKKANIQCEFVGHPVLDEIREVVHDLGFEIADFRFSQSATSNLKSKVKKELGLNPDNPVMTLMPGSRPHEIEKLLPVMLEVIREMKERYPDYQFVIPVAPNLPEKEVKRIRGWEDKQSQLLNLSSSQPLLLNGQSIKALLASDVAVIASGTATLQAAILGVPMVVVYKLSTLTYLIGRLIVKVKHISLVNILLDYLDSHSSVFSLQPSSLRIKELLQEDADRENIMNELTKIITDLKYRDEMASQLKKTADIFMDKKASLKMAGIVEKLGE